MTLGLSLFWYFITPPEVTVNLSVNLKIKVHFTIHKHCHKQSKPTVCLHTMNPI
jgi:hypothetical protein